MSPSAEALRAALAESLGSTWRTPLVVHAETGSTNDDAKALAREGCPAGTLVVADAQTKGRGRSGASWHSPPGENVYLSLVLRPQIEPSLVAPLTLVVGLVVRDVAAARLRKPVLVKWPNDILVGDRKLAGILIEGQVRGDLLASVVVGVGINVAVRSFPAPLDAIATSLAMEGATDLARASLVAEIVRGVTVAAERFAREGLGGFAERIAAADALRDREVVVGGACGIARGIDPAGRLLLEVADGTVRPITAGHVDIVPRA